MKEEQKKNILLCVAGLTPPIITETLHVLAVKQDYRIDEIRVITTTLGERIVRRRLFDSGVFRQFCRDYPKQTKNLRFDEKCLSLLNVNKTGVPSDADLPEDRLPDIRSTKDNEKAANQICEIVRFWTDDENSAQVFATVAGGRKTMGNYLAFAMSLFGRTEDTLSHVLVDEEFERPRKPPLDFYYEPPVARPVLDLDGKAALTVDGKPLTTDMAQTTLAEIPYVRLRRILGEDYGNQPGEYASFVEQIQEELDLLETNHELVVDLIESKIRISKHEFDLEPRELWIYVVFALHRISAVADETAALTYNQMTIEHFDKALRKITAAQTEETGVTDMIKEYRRTEYKDLKFGFFIDCLYRDLTRINYGVMRDSFSTALSRLNAKLKDKRIPARYRIEAREQKGRTKYNWLAATPDKIVFVE